MSSDGSELTIRYVTKRDSGTYTCLAGNTVGSMAADARLTVTTIAMGEITPDEMIVHQIQNGDNEDGDQPRE